jgi:hypothetical protein
MFILDGKPLSPDNAFTQDGIQYPANWLRLATPEEREAIGITEVPDPPYYDQRFYWGPDLPKDHAGLVDQWTTQTRTTAGTLLTPTDWMVIREADNGTVIDPDIKALREDIRLAAGTKIAAITATTTTDELAAYITGADYSVWPSNAVAPIAAEPTAVEPTPPAAPTPVADWTASANGI